MKKIGKYQQLEILRFTSVGAYLNDIDETSDSDVLLPTKYVPDDIQIGDMIDVFLYRDSEDRLIATTLLPKLQLNEIGVLTVVNVSDYGVFLNWGLEKDLLMPAGEMKVNLAIGDKPCVYVYLDQTDRLCASMRIESFLDVNAPYQVGEQVSGTVYSLHSQIGAFVAVDNRYYGLIPKREIVGDIKVGDCVNVRVTRILEDGKLDLAIRQTVAIQIGDDVLLIENMLQRAGGFLPYNDKSDPDELRRVFKMSKKAFKRSLGVLLKAQKIEFVNGGIKHKG